MSRPEGGQPANGPRAGDPVTDFAARLRELRSQAGSPSFRQLSKVTHYSSSALAEATSGKRLPSEAILRAFVTSCGAQPDEWVTLWHQAAKASTAQARATATPHEPARRTLLPDRRSVVIAAAAACGLLAAGTLLGAAIQRGQHADPAKARHSAAAVKPSVPRAADGADPVVAGCVKDARLVDKSPVMLHGRQIGALEMIYSARCAAGWARIYLYPGEPDMLGQVTIRASDGRLAAFANPLIKQVPVFTDVITPAPGECLAASAVFHPAGRAAVSATISCQNPSS